MTKKQAYKIIKKRYDKTNDRSHIQSLCDNCPRQLRKDWVKYWIKINSKRHLVVYSEFAKYGEDSDPMTSLARLILLHDFIEDTYK